MIQRNDIRYDEGTVQIIRFRCCTNRSVACVVTAGKQIKAAIDAGNIRGFCCGEITLLESSLRFYKLYPSISKNRERRNILKKRSGPGINTSCRRSDRILSPEINYTCTRTCAHANVGGKAVVGTIAVRFENIVPSWVDDCIGDTVKESSPAHDVNQIFACPVGGKVISSRTIKVQGIRTDRSE